MIFLFYIFCIQLFLVFHFLIVLGLYINFGVGVGHIHHNDREDSFVTSE